MPRMIKHDAIEQAYLYFQQGKLEAAHTILQPLAIQADAAFNVLHLAGAVAAGMHLHQQAIGWYQRALALKPGDLPVGYQLGRVLVDAGQRADALGLYLRLMADGARHADLYLATALLLQEFGRHGEALQTLEHALQLAPQHADGWHRHAVLLHAMQRPGDALHSVQQAVTLAPDRLDLRFDLALILYSLHRNDDALTSVDQVLTHQPQLADAWALRAAVLGRLRRYEASTESAEKALDLRPGDPDASVNLALTQLTLGHFDRAWGLYEARWQGELADPYRHADIPRWPGRATAAGKTILLWAEQGLGDTIQFCRYATLVSALGANVVLEVHASLVTLLQTLKSESGTSLRVHAIGDVLPPVDYQVPLLSVPLAMHMRMDTIGSPGSYLAADAGKQKSWRHLFSEVNTQDDQIQQKTLHIGIVCSGNPGNHNDRRRSIPLQMFSPLFDIEGARFFLLQPEIRQSDARWMSAVPALHWPGREIPAFEDTAALMTNMDLVIGVDTAAVHLAGALGVPVWILLSHAADWRWFLEREDSPWYASARLFRQVHAGDWSTVMQHVRAALVTHNREGA